MKMFIFLLYFGRCVYSVIKENVLFTAECRKFDIYRSHIELYIFFNRF